MSSTDAPASGTPPPTGAYATPPASPPPSSPPPPAASPPSTSPAADATAPQAPPALPPSPIPDPTAASLLPPDDDALFDESLLAMRTRAPPNDPRDAPLLEHFDRYLDASPDASAPDAPAPDISAPAPPAPDPLVRLAERFPAYDPAALQTLLESCEGDVIRATTLLAPSAPARAPQPPARPDVSADAALAWQLQRREERAARPRSVAPVARETLDEMVRTLREIVVPALRAHFEELQLPDLTEEAAPLTYALEQLDVAALSLPRENIVVKAAPDGRSIRVAVVNAHLELEVGRWRYERKGIVPVHDAGRAKVTAHGLNVNIRLEPRQSSSGGTRVKIGECVVTIDGVVRFKTEGAAADWAYNAIAVLLKPLVVSYIKEAVAETVSAALGVHLREWAFTRSLDRPAAQAPLNRQTSQSTVAAAGE